ncbi:MAG: p-hydroxybenzoate 3-monooxygenase [Solirubrobacteraceae bacterium]|nr:p-hydroxybenzoate 3-monooxygenase [Solirubrobacteraceae bacterium]
MRTRTQVAIIGAGPAGLVLANVLAAAGVECVVVEHRSREHVEARARAGFLEQRTVECLRRHGLAGRLLERAARHVCCEFRCASRSFSVPYGELAGGRSHWVYPQHELVRDLLDVLTARGVQPLFSHAAIAVDGVRGETPSVLCRAADGASVEIVCDVLAGCDGFHGVARRAIAAAHARTIERRYPFDWLAVLAEVASPVDQVVYAMHRDGFAGQMPRTPQLSRFYLECAPGEMAADWPDERIWMQLRNRLGTGGRSAPPVGRVLEKGTLTMRSAVSEPMQFGRLYLAGDAAHALTPSGAKGMNLAIADAAVLAEAVIAHVQQRGDELLRGYSAARLPDVWRAQEFSDWLLTLLHGPDRVGTDHDHEQGLRAARLDQLEHDTAFATAFARRYAG